MIIVSPLYPPARGGLADHTARLAGELAKATGVSVVTSAEAGIEPTRSVHPIIQSWRDVTALVAALETVAPAAPVIWQYVPHMYGRGGVNLALPRALAALRRAGRRQLVTAHEIAAPWSLWPNRLGYALAHRWQWRQILACADAVAFSTEAWLANWTRRAPGRQRAFFLLASPSTIPVAPTLRDHARHWRQQHGLDPATRVLAYFGSLSAAKQLPWVMQAWRQAQANGRPVALVVIGERPRSDVPAELATLYKPLGYLPAPEVSAALQATDLLALPFIDGVSERRTTFMAGLSHGCAVATTFGENTGPTLRGVGCFTAVPSWDQAAFSELVTRTLADDAVRKTMGETARAVYTERYDWPVVARALGQRLQRAKVAREGV
ncbi:MAG: glycosyltransferase [Verrucomicrobia bacterium]|nr:glycosyltransferase [Verrucomicrobiota bacterium]